MAKKSLVIVSSLALVFVLAITGIIVLVVTRSGDDETGIGPEPQPIGVPTNIRIETQGSDSVLVWDAVTNAVSYRVRITTTSALVPIIRAVPTGTSYNISQSANLPYGTLQFAVQAIASDAVRNSSFAVTSATFNNVAPDTGAAAVSYVVGLINALPPAASLTLANATAVATARAEFNALTTAQRAQVANIGILTAAEERIAQLQAALGAPQEAALLAVEALLAAIAGDNVTLIGQRVSEFESAIAVSGVNVNALVDPLGNPVTAVGLLQAAATRVSFIEMQAEVSAINGLIANLGTVTNLDALQVAIDGIHQRIIAWSGLPLVGINEGILGVVQVDLINTMIDDLISPVAVVDIGAAIVALELVEGRLATLPTNINVGDINMARVNTVRVDIINMMITELVFMGIPSDLGAFNTLVAQINIRVAALPSDVDLGLVNTGTVDARRIVVINDLITTASGITDSDELEIALATIEGQIGADEARFALIGMDVDNLVILRGRVGTFAALEAEIIEINGLIAGLLDEPIADITEALGIVADIDARIADGWNIWTSMMMSRIDVEGLDAARIVIINTLMETLVGGPELDDSEFDTAEATITKVEGLIAALPHHVDISALNMRNLDHGRARVINTLVTRALALIDLEEISTALQYIETRIGDREDALVEEGLNLSRLEELRDRHDTGIEDQDIIAIMAMNQSISDLLVLFNVGGITAVDTFAAVAGLRADIAGMSVTSAGGHSVNVTSLDTIHARAVNMEIDALWGAIFTLPLDTATARIFDIDDQVDIITASGTSGIDHVNYTTLSGMRLMVVNMMIASVPGTGYLSPGEFAVVPTLVTDIEYLMDRWNFTESTIGLNASVFRLLRVRYVRTMFRDALILEDIAAIEQAIDDIEKVIAEWGEDTLVAGGLDVSLLDALETRIDTITALNKEIDEINDIIDGFAIVTDIVETDAAIAALVERIADGWGEWTTFVTARINITQFNIAQVNVINMMIGSLQGVGNMSNIEFADATAMLPLIETRIDGLDVAIDRDQINMADLHTGRARYVNTMMARAVSALTTSVALANAINDIDAKIAIWGEAVLLAAGLDDEAVDLARYWVTFMQGLESQIENIFEQLEIFNDVQFVTDIANAIRIIGEIEGALADGWVDTNGKDWADFMMERIDVSLLPSARIIVINSLINQFANVDFVDDIDDAINEIDAIQAMIDALDYMGSGANVVNTEGLTAARIVVINTMVRDAFAGVDYVADVEEALKAIAAIEAMIAGLPSDADLTDLNESGLLSARVVILNTLVASLQGMGDMDDTEFAEAIVAIDEVERLMTLWNITALTTDFNINGLNAGRARYVNTMFLHAVDIRDAAELLVAADEIQVMIDRWNEATLVASGMHAGHMAAIRARIETFIALEDDVREINEKIEEFDGLSYVVDLDDAKATLAAIDQMISDGWGVWTDLAMSKINTAGLTAARIVVINTMVREFADISYVDDVAAADLLIATIEQWISDLDSDADVSEINKDGIVEARVIVINTLIRNLAGGTYVDNIVAAEAMVGQIDARIAALDVGDRVKVNTRGLDAQRIRIINTMVFDLRAVAVTGDAVTLGQDIDAVDSQINAWNALAWSDMDGLRLFPGFELAFINRSGIRVYTTWRMVLELNERIDALSDIVDLDELEKEIDEIDAFINGWDNWGMHPLYPLNTSNHTVNTTELEIQRARLPVADIHEMISELVIPTTYEMAIANVAYLLAIDEVIKGIDVIAEGVDVVRFTEIRLTTIYVLVRDTLPYPIDLGNLDEVVEALARIHLLTEGWEQEYRTRAPSSNWETLNHRRLVAVNHLNHRVQVDTTTDMFADFMFAQGLISQIMEIAQFNDISQIVGLEMAGIEGARRMVLVDLVNGIDIHGTPVLTLYQEIVTIDAILDGRPASEFGGVNYGLLAAARVHAINTMAPSIGAGGGTPNVGTSPYLVEGLERIERLVGGRTDAELQAAPYNNSAGSMLSLLNARVRVLNGMVSYAMIVIANGPAYSVPDNELTMPGRPSDEDVLRLSAYVADINRLINGNENILDSAHFFRARLDALNVWVGIWTA